MFWNFGTEVNEDLLTSTDVLTKFKLDWTVRKEPNMAKLENGSVRRVPKKFIIIRNDSDSILSCVGKSFVAVQNEKAAGILDAFAMETPCKFLKAGELLDGARVFFVGKLEGAIRIEKTNESLDEFFLLTNSFEGTKSLIVSFVPYSKRTGAALNIAPSNKISDKIALRHVSTFNERVMEAKKILGFSNNYFNSLSNVFNFLADTTLSKTKFESVIDAVMPIEAEARPTRAENAREKLEQLYEMQNIVFPTTANSGWNLFSAFCNFADNYKTFKEGKGDDAASKEENRFLSITESTSYKLKNDAFDTIMDVIK